MNDFDRVFESEYSAVDLFTNRRSEHKWFEDALVGHVERVLAGEATLGTTARRNVLTFYGIGGVGKSELSSRLERWVLGELGDPGEWGEPPRFDQEVRTVRVDFHGSGAVDAAGIVLKLRSAVAGSARRLSAFDLGFAAWWALAHPGTSLPQVRSQVGVDVRAQITDTLNDILSEAGARFGVGPLTVRMGTRLIDAIRSHKLRTKALRECLPLAAVIDQARRDPSPYVAASLAGLLSWDLEQLQPAQMPLVIAFADAVEYIQADDRSQERLFNRIVHLTPHILWVVTSRNSLDWDDMGLIQRFPAVGPRVWPGMCLDSADEPCQHLVGDLAQVDVLRYLHAASGSAGNPELSSEVIERICVGAHGLPLYLDLSLALAREASKDAHRMLDPAAFGGSLPELVTLVFADLPDAERDVARAASLVPRFEPDSVAQAAGVLLGDALRFCRKSVVTRDDHPLFPFRLHDAVRSAITEEPLNSPGAWAATDRAARAARLVDALRTRHDELGQTHNALAIFQGLLLQEPESELLRYQVARTLRQLGRYEELDGHLSRYPLGDRTADVRIRSDLAYDRGDIAEAITGPAERARYLHSIGNHRVALENEPVALWRAALARTVSVADCDALIAEADSYGLRSIMRTGLAAKIVCLGAADNATRDVFAEIAAIIRVSAGRPGWREWSASIINGLYTGDDRRIHDVYCQWDGARTWSPNQQFVDRLLVFAGYEPAYPALTISGADSDQIQQRWNDVIAALVR